MKLLFQLFIFGFISASLCENCDKYGILLYEDLGCTPHFSDAKSCPIKYTCTGLEPSNSNCYFRGKSYNDREKVEDHLSSPSCDLGCFCTVGVGKRAKFTCAILDCPEWLGVPVDPGCYRKYSLDSCCSTGQICPPFNDTEKCVVDGKEYKEGERFYPQNTCLECVCQKGFKGKFEEPFCKRMTCGVQLKRSRSDNVINNCAPLYGKKSGVSCCPSWICPDGSEVIKGEAKRDDVCKFGSKTLKVGQNFEKLNTKTSYGRTIGKITCECVIPPFVMCNEAEEE